MSRASTPAELSLRGRPPRAAGLPPPRAAVPSRADRPRPKLVRAGVKRLSRTLLLGMMLGAGASALAQVVAMPQTLHVDGHELILSGQGLREKFLINLYGVGLYVADLPVDVGSLRRPGLAKAFRIDVTYSRREQPVEVPQDWREELIPPGLASTEARVLHAAFGDLGEGDRIFITYVPDGGSAVELNERLVLRAPGHGLIDAYIDLWLGETPLSEELEDSLLRGTQALRP